MHASLITSTYRSEAHLSAYSERALHLGAALREAGRQLEIVIVANDPTRAESDHLRQLVRRAETAGAPRVRLLTVPRETLYASWNRGLQAASAPVFGPWNVDDSRHAAGLLAQLALLDAGCELVDAPFNRVLRARRWPGRDRRIVQPVRFQPNAPLEALTPKALLGTFFMTTRALYERVGPFDEQFRIAGDYDWSVRVMRLQDAVRFCVSEVCAGDFILHGDNLSSVGSAREFAEVNLIFMRLGLWDQVRPTPDPALMRAIWYDWGDTGVTVPPEIRAQLWGEDALQHWEDWRRARRRLTRGQRWRALPRYAINRLGLRPLLARLGWVQPH